MTAPIYGTKGPQRFYAFGKTSRSRRLSRQANTTATCPTCAVPVGKWAGLIKPHDCKITDEGDV